MLRVGTGGSSPRYSSSSRGSWEMRFEVRASRRQTDTVTRVHLDKVHPGPLDHGRYCAYRRGWW
jgi:hypothetical protein